LKRFELARQDFVRVLQLTPNTPLAALAEHALKKTQQGLNAGG
jgi:hypothetical protein